jgi:hypothetical protein
MCFLKATLIDDIDVEAKDCWHIEQRVTPRDSIKWGGREDFPIASDGTRRRIRFAEQK